MQWTYVLVDLGAILVPFIFSFHPKLRFDRRWFALWPAILIVGLVFILWDVQFTNMGVWWFNPEYHLNLELLGLPLEEWLFFVCIPYACVFTYHCFGILLPTRFLKFNARLVSLPLTAGLLVVGLWHFDQWYTVVTFMALSFVVVYVQWIAKVNWLQQFYVTYAVLLIPFFIVNGILTGTGLEDPVVLYNNAENLGIRMLTIPIEDTFYGMLLILMNVAIMERLSKGRARHSVA